MVDAWLETGPLICCGVAVGFIFDISVTHGVAVGLGDEVGVAVSGL